MKKLIICLIIVAIIASFAVPICFIWLHININREMQYGLPELIYYTSQIIVAISTLLAVIVALFGDYLKALIYGEKCEVCLVNDSFTENLAHTEHTTSPEAQSFDCSLKITNSGSREIKDCQILLKEVKYRQEPTRKYKSLKKFDHKPLYWTIPNNISHNLVVDDNLTIPLFKIYPENSCQTPDDSASSPLRIRVIGCQLDNKYTTKSGYWITSYSVQSSSKILCSFDVEVWWDGSWHNRISEMSSSVTAQLKISKL